MRRATVGTRSVLACANLAAAMLAAQVVEGGIVNPLPFRPFVAFPTVARAEAVAIGDVNGDGRNDVVVTTRDNPDPTYNYKLCVFLQTPTGALAAPVRYAIGALASSVAIGDVNNDGRLDVVVGTGASIGVFLQNFSGTLNPIAPTASPYSAIVKTARLNADTRTDVVGVDNGASLPAAGAGVFLQNGAGGLDPAVVSLVAHDALPDAAVGDLNGDGRDDIAVMGGTSLVPNVGVLLQLPGGGFAPPAYYAVGNDLITHSVAIGDVNGDGLDDLVASAGSNFGDARVAVWPQNAGGTLDVPYFVYTDSLAPRPRTVSVKDVNGDGRADVLLLRDDFPYLTGYLQKSNGTLDSERLAPLPPTTSHDGTEALAVGDVNGDGFPDVVVAHQEQGLVVLYRTVEYDAKVTLAPDTDPVYAGERVRFGVSVVNVGARPLTGVRVQYTLPPGLLLVVTDECVAAGSLVTCDLGTVDPGPPYNKILDVLAPAPGAYVVQAVVSSNETDADPSNNTATGTTHVLPLGCSDLVTDGSFETGVPNSFWLEYSSTFGTPLCTLADCGTGGGTVGPATGSVWAWFGGVSGHSELGELAQDMSFPASAVTTLRFKLWNGAWSGNGQDYLAVAVDSTPVFFTFSGNPAFTGGYTTVSADVSPFADGAFHRLYFESYTSGPLVTNFSVDDVSVASCPYLPSFLSVSDVVVTEGGPGTSTATFIVSLSSPSTKTVTASWNTTDSTARAGSDYVAASGNLVFPPGVTSIALPVTILGDRVFENEERFRVVIYSEVAARVAKREGTCVIEDDDLPGIVVDDATVTAPAASPSTALFRVTLSPFVFTPVTVDYATEDGTALAGTDYEATSGTLNLQGGSAIQDVPVTILPNPGATGVKTFQLVLSNASGAPLVHDTGTGTIRAPGFHTLTPCRVVDTRNPNDSPSLAAQTTRTFLLRGFCGIPATARAISLNVVATQPTGPGHLRLYAGGANLPTVATLNYSAGQTRANNAIVPLGADGRLSIYVGQGAGTVHVIVDVNGYFTSE